MAAPPVLWSFRRCPYAMRARLAIRSSAIQVELREVVLRDKPSAFLDTSPTATVPCLKDGGTVLDESLDIMLWALRIHDPEGWLDKPDQMALIDENDGPFKNALDRYKYASRYEDVDVLQERAEAAVFIEKLDVMLAGQGWLCGEAPRLVDMALLPFVRQFAHVDLNWFEAQPWENARRWLADFKTSNRFAAIMRKYPQWQPGMPEIWFPEEATAAEPLAKA